MDPQTLNGSHSADWPTHSHPGQDAGTQPVSQDVRQRLGGTVIATVIAITVFSLLPMLVPGAASDLIEGDLRVGPVAIGVLITLFWVGSMTGAYLSRRTPQGYRVERFCGIALAVTAAALTVAGVWPAVGLWAGAYVGGAVYGSTQPLTNFLLVKGCAPRIHGLAFGLKQASIPLATLISSLAIPTLAGPIGWRALMVVFGAACALAGAVLLAGSARRATPYTGSAAGVGVRLNWHLFALAAAGACGSGIAWSLGGFLISSLTHAGDSLATASLIASAGAITATAVRVAVGRAVDRPGCSPQRLLSQVFLVGSAGTLLLAIPQTGLQVAGALLAFGGGMGWAGLLHYSASIAYPGGVGSATAITLTGVALGGAVGPLGFGVIVDLGGRPAAWLSMTALGAAAVAFTKVAIHRSPAAVCLAVEAEV